MRSPFYNDIYEILRPHGDRGLPLRAIAKQVYNRHADLFNAELTYTRVYQRAANLLCRHAKKRTSPFVRTERWGWYAVKPEKTLQMRLNFAPHPSQEATERGNKAKEPAPDYPTLF